jgi:hypothetical protein
MKERLKRKVVRIAGGIMKDRKQIYKYSLIVVAIVTCISLLIWRHDINEGDRINAKYGITVTPKVVTSTRIIFQVECSGVKNEDSLHIDDTPFIIEKPTIFGWREVWGPGYQGGFDWAVLHSLYDGASYEFGINWELEYGKLRRGTYRVGIAIEGEGDKRIDWCYFTVKVPKRLEQEEALSLYEEEKEVKELHHEAAKNYRSWKYIQGFTSIVDEYYVKSNNWETEGVLDWNEERYLSMFHDVKPRFISNIYTAYYRDFYLKLIDENEVPKEYKDKGIQIYTDMNTELCDICTYVMEKIEGGTEKIELVKTDSELYKGLQKKVTEFGTKYSKKIGDFYKEIEGM